MYSTVYCTLVQHTIYCAYTGIVYNITLKNNIMYCIFCANNYSFNFLKLILCTVYCIAYDIHYTGIIFNFTVKKFGSKTQSPSCISPHRVRGGRM